LKAGLVSRRLDQSELARTAGVALAVHELDIHRTGHAGLGEQRLGTLDVDLRVVSAEPLPLTDSS